MEKKKGVSPVIATVLLIAMVVVIALIIFLWFRGLTKEAITKFDVRNLINKGLIKVEPARGTSKVRIREAKKQKRKGKFRKCSNLWNENENSK